MKENRIKSSILFTTLTKYTKIVWLSKNGDC